ncbi:MAG: hypothetical protein OHK0053_32020 [Microscillaceae bacterium]
MRLFLTRLFFCFLLLGPACLLAQQDQFRWRVGVYGGVHHYRGELESRIFPPNRLLTEAETDFLGYGLSLENTFDRAWSWKVAYHRGRLEANDLRRGWDGQIQRNEGNFARGLNFMAEINEWSLALTYFTDNDRFLGRTAFISPYFSLGLGLTKFDNFADLFNANGEQYYYWSDQTIRNAPEGNPGASVLSQDQVYETRLSGEGGSNYATTSLNLQAALGLKLRLSSRLNLNLEMRGVQTFTDNLDNFEEEDWYDLYGFTSVSLHYNFARRANSFRGPKIYTDPYARRPSELDSLGLVSRYGDLRAPFDPVAAGLVASPTPPPPTIVQNFQIYLRQDSVSIYKDANRLQPVQKGSMFSVQDSSYVPLKTVEAQLRESRVLRRDTTYFQLDTIQRRYLIREQVYRPQPRDTVYVERFWRDTLVQKALPRPPASNAYSTRPYAADSLRNAYAYSPYTGNSRPYTYDPYAATRNSRPNQSTSSPVNAYVGFGTTPRPLPADSTQPPPLSTDQKLSLMDEKLDLIAWQLLRMQKNQESSPAPKTDSLPNPSALSPLRRDTLPPPAAPTPLRPEALRPVADAQEVALLKQEVAALEKRMAELQARQEQSQQEQSPLDSFQLDFGLGVSQLSAAQQAQLKTWMSQKSQAGYRYRLRGYADAIGDPEKNLLLSKMRTDAVRNVLLQMGVPMEKIEAEFYGANLQSLAKRRVEVQIFPR